MARKHPSRRSTVYGLPLNPVADRAATALSLLHSQVQGWQAPLKSKVRIVP